jgi:hypothetical protein
MSTALSIPDGLRLVWPDPSGGCSGLVSSLKNSCFSEKNGMLSLCRARKILSRLADGHRDSGAKRPLLDFRVWPFLTWPSPGWVCR